MKPVHHSPALTTSPSRPPPCLLPGHHQMAQATVSARNALPLTIRPVSPALGALLDSLSDSSPPASGCWANLWMSLAHRLRAERQTRGCAHGLPRKPPSDPDGCLG